MRLLLTQVCKFCYFCPCLHVFFKYMRHNYLCAWLWKKHLLKRSHIKLTCSWHEELIILWTLNRQAKIYLPIIIYFCFTYGEGKLWQMVKIGKIVKGFRRLYNNQKNLCITLPPRNRRNFSPVSNCRDRLSSIFGQFHHPLSFIIPPMRLLSSAFIQVLSNSNPALLRI